MIICADRFVKREIKKIYEFIKNKFVRGRKNGYY